MIVLRLAVLPLSLAAVLAGAAWEMVDQGWYLGRMRMRGVENLNWWVLIGRRW